MLLMEILYRHMKQEARQKQEAMSNPQYDIQNWESFACQGERGNDMDFMDMYEVQLYLI
jgi:hypothetical protein